MSPQGSFNYTSMDVNSPNLMQDCRSSMNCLRRDIGKGASKTGREYDEYRNFQPNETCCRDMTIRDPMESLLQRGRVSPPSKCYFPQTGLSGSSSCSLHDLSTNVICDGRITDLLEKRYQNRPPQNVKQHESMADPLDLVTICSSNSSTRNDNDNTLDKNRDFPNASIPIVQHYATLGRKPILKNSTASSSVSVKKTGVTEFLLNKNQESAV